MIKIFLYLFLIPFVATAAWDIDTTKLSIPPPPAAGSKEEKSDFDKLFELQKNRTKEQCNAADAQSRYDLNTLFGPAVGILSAAEVKNLEKFGAEIIESTSNAVAPFKEKWHRKRPFNANPEIQPCITKPKGDTAYPSGHAAVGKTLSEILALIFPEKKSAILNAGFQAGENRLIGGVHHPSDVAAGRILGEEIKDELLKNTDFLNELNEVKKKF